MHDLDSRWPGFTISTSDGARLTGRDSQGPGSPVVLLHGLAGHTAEWWPVASLLFETHRVIAFDQRGHGDSTTCPQDVSREVFVRDVIEVVDRLELTQPVTLVGQSMGAHFAFLVAAAHPGRVARLVVIEGGVGGGGPEASHDVIAWFRSWPIPFPDAESATAYFGGGTAGQGWAAGLRATPQGLVPRFDVEVLREAIDGVHAEPRWAEWAAVRCPVRIIKGANGFLSAEESERMLATNPAASLIEVPEAGHDVHLDAPGVVVEQLRAFVGEGPAIAES